MKRLSDAKIFIVVFILTIALYVLAFNLIDIRLGFLDGLFKGESPQILLKLVYAEGNDIFISMQGKSKERVRPGISIKNNTVIRTGAGAYAVLYSQGSGYYTIYPNSIVFVDYIERFDDKRENKETSLVLEKGGLGCSIKYYSNNSLLKITTTESISYISDGDIMVYKESDLATAIICNKGEVFYRPFSTRFLLLKEKKSFVITESIERLINRSNRLTQGEYFVVKMNHQVSLDNLLKQLYESDSPVGLNSEYIQNAVRNTPIKFPYSKAPVLPLALTTFAENEVGFVEFEVPADSSIVTLRNIPLEKGKRYILGLSKGYHNIVQNYSGFIVNNFFSIREDSGYKHIDLKVFYGLIVIRVNGKSVSFKRIGISGESIEYELSNQVVKSGDIFELISDISIRRLELGNIGTEEFIIRDIEKEPAKNVKFQITESGEIPVSIVRLEFVNETLER